MKEKIVQHLKHITSAKVLAVLFLAFSIYVGIAAAPQFLTNSGTALTEKKTFAEYIDVIDEQYHGMLTTVLDQPVLHNKGTYINFNGLMANMLDQTEMNNRFKLKNGHLNAYSPSMRQDELDAVFKNLQALHEQQKNRDKQFLFVLAPSQMYQHEELLPTGYTDSSNTDVDYLLSLMDQHNIPYLDLRQSMAEDGISNSEAFFVTDHHWKPETGFWAYGKILEKLAENGGIDPVNTFYTDPKNYEFTVYEDSFLGSSGKRTGIYFAGVDDFCVITPKFDTSISVKIDDINIDHTKPFSEAAYFTYRLKDVKAEKKNYFNENPYAMYGWSDRALTQWKNKNAPEDQNVMLIGDSFGNVPFSFMSLYFTSCDELDMRHFKGSFSDFYRNSLPDTIVLLVNMYAILTENTTYNYFEDVVS